MSLDEATKRQRTYAQKIEQQATQHRTVRNPEATLQDRLVVESEADGFGKYPATHSFKRGDQVFHRSYNLTTQEIDSFRHQNPSVKIQVKDPNGVTQTHKSIQHSMPVQAEHSQIYHQTNNQQRFSAPGQVSPYMADTLAGSGQGPVGFSHLEYSNANLPIPMSSFQHSFNEKHNQPTPQHSNGSRTFDLSVLQGSNISGNFIDNQPTPYQANNNMMGADFQPSAQPTQHGCFNGS